MNAPTPQAQPAKPSLWQRATSGVRNFFSHAIGYIPRGIAFTGLVFATSSVIESATGFSGLGINSMDTPTMLTHFGAHMAIGSALSGVIGATLPPCPPCQQAQGAGLTPSSNPILSPQEVALGQKISQSVADQAMHATKGMALDAIAPGTGLPAQAVGAAARATGWTK